MTTRKTRHRAFWMMSAAPILLFAAGTAQAQNPPARSTTKPEAATTVEVLVVTANKREESLQDVAASISAVSGATIEKERIQTYYDLQNAVAGLVALGQADRTYLNMRGTFTAFADNPGQELPSSVYIDDVATLGETDTAQRLYDIDRVEVLKGPQGTAFGKNTIGGVISIHTKAPSFTPGLKLSATGGSYGLAEFQGSITGPLTDRVAANFSTYVHRTDGYIHNPITGATLGAERAWGLRGQVLANVTDNFTVRAGADYLKDNSHVVPLRFFSSGQWIASNSPFGRPPFGTGAFPPAISYPNLVPSNDPDTSYSPYNDRAPRSSFNAFVRADWNLEFATLTSITGYRENRSKTSSNAAGDSQGFLKLLYESSSRQWTEELRLVSPGDRKFTWLAGVYVALPHQTRTLRADPAAPGLRYLVVGPQLGSATAETTSISGFAEVGYKFTDQLKLVVGGRYTDDRKTGDAVNLGTTQGSIPLTVITAHQKASWNAFTPKGTLEYTPTSDTLFYATYSEGYVGGGFLRAGPAIQVCPSQGPCAATLNQAIAANIAALQKPYDPEYATNYEIGAKTSWFDDRLTANVSIYREDFKDLQIQIASVVGGILTRQAGNAGRTRSQGLDLEVHAVPAPWLRLGATYSYLDAKYLEFTTAGVSRAGNTLPNAPKNALNLSASGNWDFDWGKLSVGGDVTFRSKTFGDETNADAPAALKKTEIRGLVNGSIDFATPDGRWDLRLWARNLTDTRYGTPFSGIRSTAGLFGFTGPYFVNMLWNEPRTIGATLTFNMQ